MKLELTCTMCHRKEKEVREVGGHFIYNDDPMERAIHCSDCERAIMDKSSS